MRGEFRLFLFSPTLARKRSERLQANMTSQTHLPSINATSRHSVFLPLKHDSHELSLKVVSQKAPQLPLHQPPPQSPKQLILNTLISPADVLQLKRPTTRQRSEVINLTDQSEDMDKRHPSSFQQLEKVRCHRRR